MVLLSLRELNCCPLETPETGETLFAGGGMFWGCNWLGADVSNVWGLTTRPYVDFGRLHAACCPGPETSAG